MKRYSPSIDGQGLAKFANTGSGRASAFAFAPPSALPDGARSRSGQSILAGGLSPDQAVSLLPRKCGSMPACRGAGGSSYEVAKWEDEAAANALIVKEMTELSLQDRNRVLDDVHGVPDLVDETDDFLESKLQAMKTAIKWTKKKAAYELARFLSPAFVADRNFLLMFLRSTDYDAPAAARKIINYFEFKLKLYGHDALVQPITQDVLTPHMTDMLRRCYAQLLPIKDRIGRPILFVSARNPVVKDWRTEHGMLWYLCSKAAEDAEAQKKGLVLLIYSIGVDHHTGSAFSETMVRSRESQMALPIKVAANHFLYDDPRVRAIVSVIQMAHSKAFRLRTCAHFGSHMECIYKLLSFGIVPDMLPIDVSGNIDVKTNLFRLEELRKQEACEASMRKNAIIPNSRDVLLGRGYHFVNFVGNVFLADLIHRNRANHAKLKRLEKSNMSRAIVQYIKTVRSGRFLKRVVLDADDSSEEEKSAWVLATEDECWTKVSHGFRRAPDTEYTKPSVEFFPVGLGPCTILVSNEAK